MRRLARVSAGTLLSEVARTHCRSRLMRAYDNHIHTDVDGVITSAWWRYLHSVTASAAAAKWHLAGRILADGAVTHRPGADRPPRLAVSGHRESSVKANRRPLTSYTHRDRFSTAVVRRALTRGSRFQRSLDGGQSGKWNPPRVTHRYWYWWRHSVTSSFPPMLQSTAATSDDDTTRRVTIFSTQEESRCRQQPTWATSSTERTIFSPQTKVSSVLVYLRQWRRWCAAVCPVCPCVCMSVCLSVNWT